jgi:hypothetical protein
MTMTRTDTTRRQLLAAMFGLVAVRSAALFAAQSPAPPSAELPHLGEKEKAAVMFGYVEDAKKVDKATNPGYKPGQLCSNCSQLTGKPGPNWRPCKIFPGKSVYVGGWCRTYLKKA